MENKTRFRPNPEAKSMDQVKEILRYHHFGEKIHPKKWDSSKLKPFYQIWLLIG